VIEAPHFLFRENPCLFPVFSVSEILYQPALRLILRHMRMALMTLDVVIAQRVGVNAGWYYLPWF
jgi:hypothetical protein